MIKLTQLVALALLMVTASLSLNAQDASTSGTPTSQYPILTNKLKKSEKDLNNPKKTSSPKYWLGRSGLMMDIFEVNLQQLAKGAQEFNMNLMFGQPKETKTENKEGKTYTINVYEKVTITFLDGVVDSYEETEKIYDKPLPEAMKSLKKVEELDSDKKLTKKIKDAYSRLKKDFERQGIESYMAEDFKEAFNSFKSSVEINLMDMNNSVIDTTIIFNTGMTASKAGLDQESIKYYELAKSYNYPEPALYVYLKNKYYAIEDTAKGIETLKEGFEKFPGSNDIVIELINYYLMNNQADEALDYIKIAQEKDPGNISLIFAEGTLYDKKGDYEKAIETYKKTTELQPDFFNGYFNLGVVYYNRAQKLYEEASGIRDNTKYEAAIKEADEILAESIPSMEKCHELKPEDTAVLDVLKSVYYRLKMTDKYNDIKEKLGQ